MLTKLRKLYIKLREDYEKEKITQIKSRSIRQPVYAFGQTLDGQSIIGILTEDKTRLEQTLRVNFHLDENGEHCTAFSALLPFDMNAFPTISTSKLLCDPVVIRTDIEVYENISSTYQKIISKSVYSRNHSIHLN